MHKSVQEYYGKALKTSADLKTTACCDSSAVPSWLKPLLSNIHPDVLAKYYGCGLVCPPLLKGCSVLDLGSGSGRDVYALAQLVGRKGRVVGVDMTDEQLAVAMNTQGWHAEKFGFENTRFLKGYIEKLDELALDNASFDVVVSNCVINLSPNKAAVLKGIYQLLKPGGELYFSDVYADRRIPEHLRNDSVLYGECLSGALYWNDFESLARECGFIDPRLVVDRPLAITDQESADKLGDIRFYSATYRLFKASGLDVSQEDHGQAVAYKGTVPYHPRAFSFDKQHEFQALRVIPVSGNTYRMLLSSRYAEHFQFYGQFGNHFGPFKTAARQSPFAEAEPALNAGTSSAGVAEAKSSCC